MTTILGTYGDDTLAAAAAGDKVYGLSGNDQLTNAYDTTESDYGFGDTSLYGGSGNDVVTGSYYTADHASGMLVDGGFNDDLVGIASYTLGQDVSDHAVGGAGSDTAVVFQYAETGTESPTMNLSAVVSGDDGYDEVGAFTSVDVDGVSSVAIEHDISGGGNDDSIVSETQVGFDLGTDGAFVVIGQNVDGGLGNDDIQVLSTSDSVASTFTQIDVDVDAGNGNDLVDAEAFASGSGSAAIDMDVVGGNGSDIVTVVAFATTSGDNAVITNVDAGNGNDFVDVSMMGDDMVGQAFGGYGWDEMRIGMTAADAEEGGFASILMDGGVGNDTVLGDMGDLDGSATVMGGYGNDLVSVAGGSQNVIDGGAGNDTLTGGADADRFVFGGETSLDELADGLKNRDVITNYSAAEGDVLDVTNGIAEVQSWKIVSGNTELTMVGDHDLIVLQDVVISSLSDILFA